MDSDNGNGWVAVGWGMDDVMGDDTVVMCNNARNSVDLYWNVYYNSSVRFPLPVEGDITGDLTMNAIQPGDGTLYCSFTRSASLEFTSPETGDIVNNDLDAMPYNAMSSTGQCDEDGEPTRHTKAAVSVDPIDFSAAP